MHCSKTQKDLKLNESESPGPAWGPSARGGSPDRNASLSNYKALKGEAESLLMKREDTKTSQAEAELKSQY